MKRINFEPILHFWHYAMCCCIRLIGNHNSHQNKHLYIPIFYSP
nr:MAG TPA: hypothetical protein [Caudoviricetes sp.]